LRENTVRVALRLETEVGLEDRRRRLEAEFDSLGERDLVALRSVGFLIGLSAGR